MNLHRSLPLVLSLCLAPAIAAAQQPPSDFDRATARALGKEGHQALDAKEWAAAADRFTRADALVHAPTFLLGRAQALVGLGELVAAQETYSRVLREGLPPGAPPPFKRALEDARRELDALTPRIPFVTVQITGPGAASARVTIDGIDVPAAALGVKRPVDPGKHVIRAVAEGFAPAEQTVTVAEAKVKSVTLEIQRASAAPPPEPPTPGVAPPVVIPPPIASPPPAVDPAGGSAEGQRGLRTAGWVVGAVGVAGLGVGAVAGGIAVGKHQSLAKLCPGGQCVGNQSAIDSYNLTGGISTAGLVAGGVLAATGVVLLVVTAPRKSLTKDAWIAPVLGPGYAGAEGCF